MKEIIIIILVVAVSFLIAGWAIDALKVVCRYWKSKRR